MNIEKKFMNVKELSEYLRISKYTIYYWVSQKQIPHTKFRKLVRFDMNEIGKWIDQGQIETLN
ncbi:MAG: helix-turn-helix domain-containing protein [Candidatus Omnitrophica bacterium]|nr:helix-turn-helix domain-containing protein [Candidatus Omnitrophota bacterium]